MEKSVSCLGILVIFRFTWFMRVINMGYKNYVYMDKSDPWYCIHTNIASNVPVIVKHFWKMKKRFKLGLKTDRFHHNHFPITLLNQIPSLIIFFICLTKARYNTLLGHSTVFTLHRCKILTTGTLVKSLQPGISALRQKFKWMTQIWWHLPTA